MIDTGLPKNQLNILKVIQRKHNVKMYLFGSRTNNTFSKYSDIDIYIEDDITNELFWDIYNDLEESDLFYKFDLVQKNRISSKKLKMNINENKIELSTIT